MREEKHVVGFNAEPLEAFRILLIAPDIHVVRVCCVACLLFIFLATGPIGMDLVAIQRAER
jgi:hypothetical protein